MRFIRLILRDRGALTPLIAILLQLVLIHAGASALTTGTMAADTDSTVWCLGAVPADETGDGTPVRTVCPCASLCAAQAGAHLLVGGAGHLVVLETREAGDTEVAAIADPGLPRRPPPRPGLSRAPPAA